MTELKVLKGKYGEIFQAVMNAIIPRGGAFKAGAADYDLLPRAEEILQSYDPAIRNLIPLILSYIQYTALFHKGRFFTNLKQEKAVAFLSSMEDSPFYHRRMIVVISKLLTMLCFYEIDDVALQIGYEHECHPEEKSAKKKKAAASKKSTPVRKKRVATGKKRTGARND